MLLLPALRKKLRLLFHSDGIRLLLPAACASALFRCGIGRGLRGSLGLRLDDDSLGLRGASFRECLAALASTPLQLRQLVSGRRGLSQAKVLRFHVFDMFAAFVSAVARACAQRGSLIVG